MAKTVNLDGGTEDRENLLAGFKLRHTLQGHDDIITQVSWSPDGRKLASASNDHTVRLWDAETGELCYTFEGHSDSVHSVAWSPDGKTLVSADNSTTQLWDVETGKLHWKKEEGYSTKAVVWSPDGQTLASGRLRNNIVFLKAQNGDHRQRPQKENQTIITSFDQAAANIKIYNYFYSDLRIGDVRQISSSANTGSFLSRLRHFTDLLERGQVYSVAWSPDGQTLASACADDTIGLHDAETMEICRELKEHNSQILNVAWSPDGQMLASAFLDGTVRLWDAHTRLQTRVLEGHADAVTCISFSFDGRFLASKSLDDTVRLWRCDTWETIAVLYEPASGMWLTNAIFHPRSPTLATLGEKDAVIHIWDLDFPTLLNAAPVTPSVRYINAKVVLVGDTGVGKSGLGLVLSNHFFSPTESTHGRHVWTFDKHGSVTKGDRVETHETLLWDLAGQPGYRLIHQLHLNEVAVALVVFDARSETDPFAGVRYWDRALRLAQRIQGNSTPPLKKFLVAARADRGGVGVSPARIESLKRDLGFADYFETSAKEGWGISQLAEAICGAIDWTMLPCVNSTRLFQRIKEFLVAEKESGRLLSTLDDLYRAFLKSENESTETENLRSQFETCIGRVESRGLIRRLSFGNLVLLQPELLDAYASALVMLQKMSRMA